MADKLPPELVRQIVSNLSNYHDGPTLKAAALAASILRGPCQERLFSSLYFVGAPKGRSFETPCLRLLRRFHNSPILGTYVKTVDIHGHDGEWFADDFLAKLLSYLAGVGLVTKFHCGVMDFQWAKPPLEVQEAITQLIMSRSMRVVQIGCVPMDKLDLGNPNLRELTLLSAMDHPRRIIYSNIRSDSNKKAEIEQLTISQSEFLVSALMKPDSGISWGSLRALTLKGDLLHNSPYIAEMSAMLNAVGPTLEFFQFESDLLRASNGPIDLSMLTGLRCLGIVSSPSLAKMLGVGTGAPLNPFVESLHALIETVSSRRLRTIGLSSGTAARPTPHGPPAQAPAWDLDFEINNQEAWANLVKTIVDRDRFPALREFVLQGWGVEEGIRKYLPHLDGTGLLFVDSKCGPEMAMGGFQVVSVSHGPPNFHGMVPALHAHGHPHAHGHGHGHDHGANDPNHGHSHGHYGHYDQGYSQGHTHDLEYMHAYGHGEPSQDQQQDGGYYSDGEHPHYGHGHSPLN